MASTDPASFQAQLDADPRIQAILRDPSLLSRDRTTRIEAIVRQLGVPEGYYVSDAGKVTKKNPWWEKYVAPAAAASAGYALSTLGAAAPSIAAGGSAASAAPGTIAGTSYGTGMAAAAPHVGSTILGTAAATGGSIWSKLAPTLVGAGLQTLGSIQQSRAANKASQQMVDASNRALDFSKGIYADQKANQAPFIGVGQGAISSLGQMLRIPQNSPQAMTTPAQGPLTALSQGQNPGTVMMRAPDGSTRAVPASQVAMLQAKGAQVVQ